MKHSGIFITLEGIDGTGKSTQYQLLVRYLKKCGYRVCPTREPGGTRVGEQIRHILLASSTQKLSGLAELALMYAARAQHLEEVVRPALKRGEVVVSDRFSDASMAYQGYGRKLGTKVVETFDRVVCGATQPHLTLVLDLSPKVALARAQERERQRQSRQGRFESEGLKFQERVRRGYLVSSRNDPTRVKVIDASGPVSVIHTEIRRLVEKFMVRRGHGRTKKTRG